MLCTVYSIQCELCNVHVQIQGYLQMQVQCVVYTLQCVGCSVLPAKDKDLAVETG